VAGASLAVESPGDSGVSAAGSSASLAVESPGDSRSPDRFFLRSPEAAGDLESPGDSLARGDSEGALDADSEGLDDGNDGLLPLEGDGLDGDPLPDPLPGPPPELPPDPLPLDGEEDGEDVGALVGVEDGDDVGDGEAAITGGATPGGAALPLPCFHAQPTDPPAGTVREPEL
jgi:hypothetical protein